MTTYYDDMSESAALNFLAGTTDFGDASAIRRIAAYIDAATGSGSPEGAVTGNVGDLYTDYTNGHLYIKGSGAGTNTGWVQIESATSGSGDVNGPGSATDNALVRFDGTGGKTVQGSGITVDDSNNVSGLGTVASGAVTSSAAVQAAAASGFVVGSSGPRIMSGAGSPEGVVTAPVGSQWIDTAATTGAVAWRKATGAGSSGWVVEYGDTGWRNLTAVSLANGWTTSSFYLRRVGNVVNVSATFSKASASAVAIYAFPSGFRCTPVDVYGRSGMTNTADDVVEWYVIAANHYLCAKYTTMTGSTLYLQGSWLTTDAWPSSLPGTA